MDQDLPVPFLGLRFAGDGLTFLAAFLAGTFPVFFPLLFFGGVLAAGGSGGLMGASEPGRSDWLRYGRCRERKKFLSS